MLETEWVPGSGSVPCRAVDNQVYVATASPARDERASYISWGHSTVVNPWYVKKRQRKENKNRCPLILGNLCSRGEVISKAGPEEAIIYAEIGERQEQL